ncbi:ubiquitin-specific protease otu1 [Rhizophlyctis rosea]|nr:ubiquitin-specific protease otu1 [Rhizophlyctis rosea]
MRLRCRGPSGVQPIGASLTPDSTVADLRKDIEAVTGVPAERQQLKFGFPPKPLTADPSTTLFAAGIKDGEQLTVEQGAAPSAAPAQPAAATQQPPSQTFEQAPAGSFRTQVMPQTYNSGISQSEDLDKDYVTVGDGVLVVREMKDDNSCLFRSIGYIFERSPEAFQTLRETVSSVISQDPFNYNEAILGKDPDEYRAWITKPQSWGGAIELAMFSDHYQVEIDSIDVSTLRVDRFGEGKYPNRVIVLYTGIHYDAVALAPFPDAPSDFDQTTFEGADGEKVLEAGVKLAGIWKKKRKFTDLANFTLKCGVCGKGLVGQKDAQAHAMQTGHASFTEY